MSMDPQSFENQPTPPKSTGSNPWKIIVIVLAVGTVLAIVVCGGLIYWGMTKGLSMAAEVMIQPLSQEEAFVENIGDVQSAKMNLGATGAVNQGADPNQRVQTIVLDVTGSKGSGQVLMTIDQSNPQDQAITEAKLVMANGDEHDLVPEGERIPIEGQPQLGQ